MQTFYGLKEGEQEEITIKFEANPEPTEGFWTMAGVEAPVRVGEASADGNFVASSVVATEVSAKKSLYRVSMLDAPRCIALL